MLADGWWFSPGTPASSTTKTGRHDIDEIMLKVVLNTKNQNQSERKKVVKSVIQLELSSMTPDLVHKFQIICYKEIKLKSLSGHQMGDVWKYGHGLNLMLQMPSSGGGMKINNQALEATARVFKCGRSMVCGRG